MLSLFEGILIGGGSVAAIGLARRHATRRTILPRDLDRFLRGRQAVLAVLARDGPLDFAHLYSRLRPRPRPESLADWLAALLTDGSLSAMMDQEGRAAFVLAGRKPAAPTVRVTLDERALERFAARHEEEHRESTRSAATGGSL